MVLPCRSTLDGIYRDWCDGGAIDCKLLCKGKSKRSPNLSASQSTSTGMLSMFADTAIPGRDMATVLPRLGKSSRHLCGCLSAVDVGAMVQESAKNESFRLCGSA
jgi:hypothetical protein